MGSEFGRTVRQLRDRCELSQEDLAGLTGISRRWLVAIESGREPKLSHALKLATELARRLPNVDVGDLLKGYAGPGARPIAIMDDMERRRFMQYLGALGGASLVDTDRAASALTGIARPDERLLDDLEVVSQGLTNDYWMGSPASVVPAVHGHLYGLRKVLAQHDCSGLSRRLRRMTSDTAALAGWLSFRLENRDEAYALWAFATALAEEANDGPLRAHVLISRSNLYSGTWQDGQGGDADMAIALLDSAAAAAGPQSSPLLRAWLYARRAEEHAMKRSATACYEDLERAERALSQAAAPHDGFLRSWDSAQLAGYHGNCAQLLGRPKEATSVLEEVLPLIPTSLLSQRCALLTNLAAAYAQQGRDGVDPACTRLREAIAIAGPAGLAVAQHRILGVRGRRLTSFSNSSAVKELNAQLRVWTTPS